MDAFLQNWSKWTCLIHPPVVLLPRVLRKIKEDQATAVLLIAPNWTGQPWFPDLVQMLVDRPLLQPQRQYLLILPFQPTAYHPLWKSLHLTVWPLLWAGPSKEVVDILLASWGTATQKQYSGPWKAWVRWCSQRGSCPISGSVTEVLAFLAFLVTQGTFKYRTISLYRSAISQAHDPVGSTQLGSLPVVARFIKGVFKMKPPKPRYRSTCNVQTALSFLGSLEPLEELTLKRLCFIISTDLSSKSS